MADIVIGLHPQPNGQTVPKVKRADRRHWTTARENKFLDHLAATCNVAAALRAVGMSNTTVYRHRQRSAHFRCAWDHALAEGYARLEAMLLDRALNGRRVMVERDGEMVETVEYSDTLAVQLLAHHRRMVADIRAANVAQREDPDVVRARIVAQIMKVVEALPDRVAGPLALPAPSDLPAPDVEPPS